MRKLFTFLAAVCLVAQAQAVDYTNGVFILNEEQYGVMPSALNFYSYDDNTIHKRVFQAENATDELDATLGETCDYAEFFNGNLYLLSKQNRGNDANNAAGGRLIVADAKTLKLKYNLREYPNGGDSRAFCGVTRHKGYVGTTAGIYVLNLDNFEFNGIISGSEGESYSGQPGDMVLHDGLVYVAKQSTGVMVIDGTADAVIATIELPGIATVFEADGKVYAAVNTSTWGTPGESDTEQFVELSGTQIVKTITVPMSCSNTWFAWQPSKPAVKGSNLYYNPASMVAYLCKYDLAAGTFTQQLTTFTDGFMMYAPCVGLDPKTGDLMAVTFKGYANTNYNFNIINPETGAIKETVPMNGRYWFSCKFLFPDEAVVTKVENVETEKTVAGVKYYNLAGVQSNEPFSGVNIVVTTFTDGSTTSKKEIRR